MAALAASGHDPVSLDQAGDPPVDLGNESTVRAAAGSVLVRHGRCDVLVHAAAAFDRADLASVDLTTAQRDLPAAAFDQVRARQALPRTLLPVDVAATVAFLASDAAALTGQVLCTDGGLILR